MSRKLIEFSHFIAISEEVKFIGDGEYNLNALTSIEVTDSYLGLDQDVRKCQSDETYQTCTSRQYHDTFLGHCGCLPFYMNLDKVTNVKK